MKRIQVVILDLDGTLIDERGTTDRAFLAAGRLLHEHVGIAPDRFARVARVTAQRLWWRATWIDPLSDAFGISAWDGLSENFERAVPALDRMRAWLPAFRQAAWKLALDNVGAAGRGLAEAVGAVYTQHRHEGVRLLPGAADLVETLVREQRRLVVLTNGPGDGQRRKLGSSGLLEYMRGLVISTEVGFAKPDPRAVSLAIERAGGRYEEAVVVGDTYDRDVLGAFACKVPAIWITDQPASHRPQNPLAVPVRSTRAVLPALYALESLPAHLIPLNGQADQQNKPSPELGQ
ncbi:HAD family hydrolase [Streptomyces caatingaensis]|uniref:HAD family hydrolase n=1 Tax=Streptomyces caatingaensis TaxID=1678637 RepID=UPI00099D106E|nr:HAD family hydrolase [Streptomyces caatingaensis]